MPQKQDVIEEALFYMRAGLPRSAAEAWLESLSDEDSQRLLAWMTEASKKLSLLFGSVLGLVGEAFREIGQAIVYEKERSMDYLKLAREAYECAQAVDSSVLAEEHRRCADTCARIAIAEQLCRLNDSLGSVRLVIEDRLGEMGIGTPV